MQYSENLAGASWTTGDNTRTANYATSPDGTTNATRIVPNTNNVAHPTYQVITVGASTSITAYAKADGYNFFQIYGGEASGVSGSSARFSVVVNLSTFAVDTIDTISSSQVNITNMGNGWAKITINNFTQFTSGNYFLAVAAIPSSGLSRNSVLDIGYAGNGTSGVLAYGIQVEAGSYPTSYIPTTSASVTRVADAASKTGISSLIGQSEGTIFADIPAQIFNYSAYQTVSLIYPSAGLGSTYFHLYKYINSRTLYFEVWNSSPQCSINFAMSDNTRYKIAATYKNNDFALYVNGTQIGTDTSGTIASVTYSTLQIGYDSFNANPQMALSQFVLFKTRLTNDQLAALTTL